MSTNTMTDEWLAPARAWGRGERWAEGQRQEGTSAVTPSLLHPYLSSPSLCAPCPSVQTARGLPGVSKPGPPALPQTADSYLHSLDVSGEAGVTAACPRRRQKGCGRKSPPPRHVPPACSSAHSQDLLSVARLLTSYTVTHGPDFSPRPRRLWSSAINHGVEGCHSRLSAAPGAAPEPSPKARRA